MSHTTANAPASPASPPTTGGAGTSPSGQVTTNKAVNSQWTITLFGTAVGAGILFLPISAGSFGFKRLLHRSHLLRNFLAGQSAIYVEQFGLYLGAVAFLSNPIAEDLGCL